MHANGSIENFNFYPLLKTLSFGKLQHLSFVVSLFLFFLMNSMIFLNKWFIM